MDIPHAKILLCSLRGCLGLLLIGSWKMFVNVVNKHVFVYFILFCLLAQWEGEMNICDCWPSKGKPIKNNEGCSEEEENARRILGGQ
jgi:hypothetical protein